MSKKGRARRTPEQRIAAKDNRSTVAYIKRLAQEARREETDRVISETLAADAK